MNWYTPSSTNIWGSRVSLQRYVRGFLSGGWYEEIPLEKQAYELEAKFATNPDRIFSVEEDVLTRIQLNQR